MCCSLFHGDPNTTCGTMSSGGSDSIFLACKAYVFYARQERGIRRPNIVLPVTFAYNILLKGYKVFSVGGHSKFEMIVLTCLIG